MASSKDRQRALARAKAERQLARRAAAARRRRQWQAGVSGGVTIAVVAVIGAWIGGVFDTPPPKPADCVWSATETNTNARDVGKPPTRGIPKSGVKTMTMQTSQGKIEMSLDLKHAPCAGANFTYLASKKFFDNTKCHKMVTDGNFFLQCGDPTGTDQGGPTYSVPSENLPAPAPSAAAPPSTSASAASPSPAASSSSAPATTINYPRGTLALYNNNDAPGSNGSQFIIVYKDSPNLPSQYSIIGTVTAEGLQVVDKIAAAGVEDIGGQAAIGGKPKLDVTVQTLTVGPRRDGSALPASAAAPSPTTAPPPATSAPAASPPAATDAAAGSAASPSGSATP